MDLSVYVVQYSRVSSSQHDDRSKSSLSRKFKVGCVRLPPWPYTYTYVRYVH